nr:type ISP restriction/modification enzyme [Mesorhizobium sp.]
MDNRFDTYLKALAGNYRDGGTEHTGRTALENLLNRFAGDAMAPGTTVQHEPQRETDKGAPDFKVKRQGMILGYVEVKEIGANLDKVLKSPQIEKYRTLSDNIVVTDYLQFIRIDGAGKVADRQSLAFPSDLEGRAIHVNADKAEAVAKLLSAFFSSPPQGLAKAERLAVSLATRSKLLRDYLTEELTRQTKVHKEGRLHGLYDVFREQVFHELTVTEFADAFAQMLAYGLFLAKLNAKDDDIVTLDNVRRFIPGSFRLIRELVRFLEEMQEAEYDEAKWVIDEILSIVNGLAIASIREDLSFRQRKAVSRNVRAGEEEEHRLFERDPFIYFYEDFLKAYDKETRKARGVYYTPPPVVNFIVRAVDDILKDTFKIADGLADHRKVTVLDFAAGTGTFLLEVMQRIFDNIGGPEAGKADSVVREHMLKNLYGFEYLIAPYTIAHLKLSQYLKDKGHPLADDERLQVFLTNTLEPVAPQKNAFLPGLSAEVAEAQKVKEKPILVILGNPPYSGHSKNKGKWITSSIAEYRKGFPELSKPAQGKWLQDDYVKFIRFAQMKMDGGTYEVTDENGQLQTAVLEGVDQGVVGIISNHSWLDNPTFKGMRKSLMGTFDQIHILDLHGNAKKNEHASDGGKDENVFDIEQGVAIALFVKRPGLERGVWHGDLWGKRLEKYQALANAVDLSSMPHQLEPHAPDWLLRPQDNNAAVAYRDLWSIPTMFSPIGDPAPGIVTTHDEFAISFTAEEAHAKVQALLATSDESEARRLFSLCSTDQWRYHRAMTDLVNVNLAPLLTKVLYRPFDIRWTVWDRNVAVHRRERVMKHMLSRGLGLIFVRQVSHSSEAISVYAHATDAVIDNRVFLSSRGIAFVAPLYLIVDDGASRENLSPDFRAFLDTRYDHHYSPEEILGYIYAVLHAPTYRSRYADFLRIDFPRIPFVGEAEVFERLSVLGWALVQAHLMRDLPKRGLADYHGKGTNEVEHVRWSAEDSRISINATQSFAPVPEAVWTFHIGGYQVIDKYLKSRKGRTLSLDEINHVGRIADALAFTIDQMAKIDAAYAQAFPDRG